MIRPLRFIPALLLLAAATAGADPATQPDAQADTIVRQLVGQLNSRSYRAREQAQAQLASLTRPQLDRLAPLYKSAGPEARLRMREVARGVFLRTDPAGGEAFLGVSHVQVDDAAELLGQQERIAGPVVQVQQVWDNSPARQAAIHDGDMLIKLDGKPIHKLADGGFAAQVRLMRPGAKVKLTLLRHGQQKDVDVTLADRSGFATDSDPLSGRELAFQKYWHDKFDSTEVVGAAPGNMQILVGNGQIFVPQVQIIEDDQ